MSFNPTISEEEIEVLPRKLFHGSIVVVETDEALALAVDDLKNHNIIGFDTETRPSFTKGVSYPMALLQLSTRTVAYLIRLNKVNISQGLIDVLQSKTILKIGAALADDVRGLQKLHSFIPDGYVDLQKIVYRWGVEDKSVKKMAAIFLGIKMSKAQRLSNWQAVNLTESQMDYAAMDAWVCGEIFRLLISIEPKDEQGLSQGVNIAGKWAYDALLLQLAKKPRATKKTPKKIVKKRKKQVASSTKVVEN